MKFSATIPMLALAVAATTISPDAFADYTVKCESFQKNYKTCKLNKYHGYVRLERKLRNSKSCVKGRTWDFNRREIWVDEGCKAEFFVETPYGYNKNNNNYNYDSGRKSSSSSDAGKAVAAIAGIAILGALLGDKDGKYDDDYYSTKYDSDNYYGSRHNSYVPGWAKGKFRGYNEQYGEPVSMKIDSEGKVKVNAGGQSMYGYYNDDKIHIGNITFDVVRTPRGFETRQHGDFRNTVRYSRAN